MKQILIAIFILFSVVSQAHARRVVSHKCNYNYEEGVKIMKSSTGVVLRVCWDKKYLPNRYETDFYSQCAPGHRESKKIIRSEHFDNKECVKKSL